MSSTPSRLRRVGVAYGLALGLVLGHLALLMLGEHDRWLVRSYQNRWSFRDVPSVRGALRDRFDRLLVHDEPTFELACVYERFRLLHPVGAAIHGATLWSRAGCGAEVRYAYADVAAGPEAAVRELLAVPLAAVAALGREQRRELLQCAVTVLAACSEESPARVRQDLRAALARPGRGLLGGATGDRAPARLEEQFAAILGRLRALDATLRQLLPVRRASAAAPAAGEAGDDAADDPRGLLTQLDRLRQDSLEGCRTRHRAADGSERQGELFERLARPLLRDVPFAVAAAIRVAASDQPGLLLEPSLRRVRAPDLPPTLAQLLGSVADLDRDPGPAGYVETRVEDAIADDLDELVPDELAPTPDYGEALREQAQRSYEHALRAHERRGSSGIESTVDAELRGVPGLRLVEHDAQAREQLLWGSLRVQPGTDVALTIDLDLQRLLEQRVAAAAVHWQEVAVSRDSDPQRIDVACALVDAISGDVLALAGAPDALDGRPRVPAVLCWRGNGAIGSLCKPLFLVEQFASAAQGLPHGDLAAFLPCNRVYRRIGGQLLKCDGRHGDAGRQPEFALAHSCNVFFYQLAEGLQEEGLRRALWRFGLLPPPAGDGDGRGQERPAELPAALAPAPRWQDQQLLQNRGIGYGIESNPLLLARAYAALATGELPTLGLRRGAARPHHPLGVDADELAVVVAGLRACVESGTGKGLELPPGLLVHAKTGTAEIGLHKEHNNAWFAGFLPARAAAAVQLCFCAVVYAVPDKIHGADAAGMLVADVLTRMLADATLAGRYLVPESRR